VRAFADQYPDEVVGLVLVDGSHPDQWLHIPISMRGALPGFANRVLAVLAGFGLLRVVDVLTLQIAMGLPEHQYAEMRAIIAQPRSSWTGAQTLSAWDELTRPRINNARSLGDLPLAVLSVTEQRLVGETLTALQNELPRSRATACIAPSPERRTRISSPGKHMPRKSRPQSVMLCTRHARARGSAQPL